MHEPFAAWARDAGAEAVLDIGSGGGGPCAAVLAAASEQGAELPRWVLSDRVPDFDRLAALAQAAGGRLDYWPAAVQAPEIPADAPRAWSICATFHHLDRELAASLVAAAVRDGCALFIIEPFHRDARHLLTLLLLTLPAVLLGMCSAFGKHFSVGKFLITFCIPLVPVMVHFDGLVSVLRTYHAAEVKDMIPDAAIARVQVANGSFGHGFGMRSQWVSLVCA